LCGEEELALPFKHLMAYLKITVRISISSALYLVLFMLTIVSALGNLVTTFKMFLFPFPSPLTWKFVNNWSALSFASLESYFFLFGGGARVWVKTSFLGSSNAHHPLLLLGLWSIISALK
jgi:hypothetical protein